MGLDGWVHMSSSMQGVVAEEEMSILAASARCGPGASVAVFWQRDFVAVVCFVLSGSSSKCSNGLAGFAELFI